MINALKYIAAAVVVNAVILATAEYCPPLCIVLLLAPALMAARR